jgi:hypothetical protein
MTTLTIEPARRLADHFGIPPDNTLWDGRYLPVPKAWTPSRERAFTLARALVPLSDWAKTQRRRCGVYIMAFDFPSPSLYFGIAANDGKCAEGFLTRFRKHRVKASGSHVGRTAGVCGGVHHPAEWRSFAQRRHEYFREIGVSDALEDVRVLTATVHADGSPGVQRKLDLQRFEAAFCRNDRGWRDRVAQIMWPGIESGPRLLTSGFQAAAELLPSDGIDGPIW